MPLPEFILKRIPKGRVLITESNPKNEKYLTAHLEKFRFKVYHAGSLEEAKKIIEKKKILGVVLDHNFRHDHDHTGLDLVQFVRKERAEELRGLPLFLVTDIETATLQEYEYLKINRYFDTEISRVGAVVREMEPYFIERD